MLPNFVVIGGMKCGSTALWHYLRQHPEIFLPEKRKNLEFFDSRDNWQRGLGWYQSFYRGADGFRAIGEVSTEYTKYPGTHDIAANMATTLPGAKLVYLVRNPVERTISHYLHMVGEGRERRSVEQALERIEGNPYVDISRYYYQLEQFLPYYPKERILIVLSERLRDDRQQTMETIFRFLEIDPDVSMATEIRANQYSERRRWNRLGRRIRINHKRFNAYRYYQGKYPKVMHLVDELLSSAVDKPTLPIRLRDKLCDSLRPDVAKLQAFSGLDLGHWNLLQND